VVIGMDLPVYWWRFWALRASTTGVKTRGPTSVTVPAVEMASILSIIPLTSSVVSPFSESWKCTASTAMDASIETPLARVRIHDITQPYLLPREPCASPMGNTLHLWCARWESGSGIASTRTPFQRWLSWLLCLP